ncbi:MAG: 30S ribosome-binding factor RbfA [Phycisphaerales bacterium]|nr:30S ribosome-binding factor RbfA [Phycisphaerales bacterium]
MTHRREQLASSLQRAIQQIIARGLSDPRISGLVTVTSVDIDPELRTAAVYISVLPVEREALTLHGLNHSARHIRHKVGDLIDTRTMPELAFRVDKGLKKEAAIHEALAKARQVTPPLADAQPASPDDPDPSNNRPGPDAHGGRAEERAQ